jgi:DNA-binding MarR family transcriptional regulator
MVRLNDALVGRLNGQKWRGFGGFCHVMRRPTHKQQTERAFRAYLDLIDTADWLKREMRAPLEAFDMTMIEFRLMEMLYREGALTAPDVARRIGRPRQDVQVIIGRLQERGWLGCTTVSLPPVEFERAHVPKAEQDGREGRKVGVVGLTASGKKLMGTVLPRHAKLVRAMMCVLDAREKDSISKVCRKLRRGDAVKFLTEMRFEEVEED